MILIPHQKLSEEILTSLIEEFVTRDGTEDSALETKTRQVHEQLIAGKVVIVYDEETESCTIVTTEAVKALA